MSVTRNRALLPAALTVSLVATTLAGAAPAHAAGTACEANGADVHCYSTIAAGPFSPAVTRFNATMRTQCMQPASEGAWMTHSLWGQAADGGTVETGLITAPTGNHPRGAVVYWVRYGGSYGTGLQLYYTTIHVAKYTNYLQQTQWNPGNSTFTIYSNGALIGTLSSPRGAMTDMQVGFETAQNNNNDWGDIFNVQRVQNAVTYQGLTSGGAPSQQILNSPPFLNPPIAYNPGGGEIANRTASPPAVACTTFSAATDGASVRQPRTDTQLAADALAPFVGRTTAARVTRARGSVAIPALFGADTGIPEAGSLADRDLVVARADGPVSLQQVPTAAGQHIGPFRGVVTVTDATDGRLVTVLLLGATDPAAKGSLAALGVATSTTVSPEHAATRRGTT